MSRCYDGIILGTGHNALVLQAYLARCGLRTLALEQAPQPGGGLLTMENPRLPGVVHHPHSFFHRGITLMPWYRDLELERHNVRYLQPELNAALVLPDGRTLQWWNDLDRTAASFAEFSRQDAHALRHWVELFRPIVQEILIPEAQSPPLPPARRRELLARTASGRQLLKISALSPLEFVTREFHHDAVRAGLLFFNGLREVDLRLKGFGHAIPALLASPARAQMCAGGSANLAKGLIADITEHGGEIQCNVDIRRIRHRGTRATGVELADGKTIQATGFVVSGLNPHQTFLQLAPEDLVPEPIRARARQFEYNLVAPLFALHVALREPPRYEAATSHPELADALMVILGLEQFQQFEHLVKAHLNGSIPPTIAWGSCPTHFDASQAPPGCHSAFLWEKVPFALHHNAANWETEKEAHGKRLLQLWQNYAPNLGPDSLLDQFCLTPPDTENRLPNMQQGDLLVGSFDRGQTGYHRPFPGAGQYRTPIKGLYLCGGSTHPGGNITGLCGYNAANVLAADFSLPVWWNPPSIETHLAALPQNL